MLAAGRAFGPENVTVLERAAMTLTIARLINSTPWEHGAHRNLLRDIEAEDAGVEVAFVRGDAATPVERDAFDVAFARLLLSHLVDPMAVVRPMRTPVRVGGTVAVEDLFAPSLHAEPPVPALDRLADVYCATVRRHGGTRRSGRQYSDGPAGLLLTGGRNDRTRTTCDAPSRPVVPSGISPEPAESGAVLAVAYRRPR
jgi:SAM-dependent methyltransferase